MLSEETIFSFRNHIVAPFSKNTPVSFRKQGEIMEKAMDTFLFFDPLLK